MAKPRKTLTVRLPEYVKPRNRWRQLIRQAVRAEQERSGVAYSISDRLEVRVRLYMSGRALLRHDVDNRLKDIMDALQGRLGGSKRIRPRGPVIPNDSQVWKVVVEKRSPPKQSRRLGHLEIRTFRGSGSGSR